MSFTLLAILVIICSLLLVLVVLVQNSEGGGLASNFSAANQYMGVQKAKNSLDKLTWGLAVGLAILCFVSSVNSNQPAESESIIDDIEAPVTTSPIVPTQSLPVETTPNN